MAVITMKQLLEAGVHFGHQTRKWNPKMKKYIFAARNDIHIIDLQLTATLIEEAYKFVCDSVKEGKTVLFVGTKKQAQEAIKEEAERCGQFYVNSRWLGGCLTNFKTMRSRVDRLEKLEKMEADGEFDLLPKKEVMLLKKEMTKLQTNLNGIKKMKSMPGIMFVVDPHNEDIAVKEARKAGIWLRFIALSMPFIKPVSTSSTRFHMRMTEEMENTVGMNSSARKNLYPAGLMSSKMAMKSGMTMSSGTENTTKMRVFFNPRKKSSR